MELSECVEFLDRLEQNDYVIKITRQNFTKVIPRIYTSSDTPYPINIPFTYENVYNFYQSNQTTL